MKFLKLPVFLCVLLLISVPAYALMINPDDDPSISGPEFKMPDVLSAIQGELEPYGLDPKEPLYKSEVDDGESGPLAGSYDTSYYNEPDDPSEATITYVDGQPYVGSPAWLLVVDGKHDPGYYLFNLDDLGWNGTDDLELVNFWPDQGAISNLSLYGTRVSEPATMLLLGSGLICLAGIGRKFRKR
jgi:hypothetical protein